MYARIIYNCGQVTHTYVCFQTVRRRNSSESITRICVWFTIKAACARALATGNRCNSNLQVLLADVCTLNNILPFVMIVHEIRERCFIFVKKNPLGVKASETPRVIGCRKIVSFAYTVHTYVFYRNFYFFFTFAPCSFARPFFDVRSKPFDIGEKSRNPLTWFESFRYYYARRVILHGCFNSAHTHLYRVVF